MHWLHQACGLDASGSAEPLHPTAGTRGGSERQGQ